MVLLLHVPSMPRQPPVDLILFLVSSRPTQNAGSKAPVFRLHCCQSLSRAPSDEAIAASLVGVGIRDQALKARFDKHFPSTVFCTITSPRTGTSSITLQLQYSTAYFTATTRPEAME
jgi:hypothetical protein